MRKNVHIFIKEKKYVIYSYNGILLCNKKKNELLIHLEKQMHPKTSVLGERS